MQFLLPEDECNKVSTLVLVSLKLVLQFELKGINNLISSDERNKSPAMEQ
jgi:hypothetical protein